eukprot:scaffold296859_cov33-Tisochrysis_lutea.AAC.3
MPWRSAHTFLADKRPRPCTCFHSSSLKPASRAGLPSSSASCSFLSADSSAGSPPLHLPQREVKTDGRSTQGVETPLLAPPTHVYASESPAPAPMRARSDACPHTRAHLEEVGQHQLEVDYPHVAQRVDRAVDVHNVRILEAAHHMHDRVASARRTLGMRSVQMRAPSFQIVTFPTAACGFRRVRSDVRGPLTPECWIGIDCPAPRPSRLQRRGRRYQRRKAMWAPPFSSC